jgi:signal transduction histidine kinase
MSAVGGFVLAGSAETVHNLTSQGWNNCSGLGGSFPALPPNGGPCDYGPPVVTMALILMAAALLLTVWGWWRLAGWALQPLFAAAETVRRLGPQNLGQRIRLDGAADSFKDLADALDDALDRLAAGYESQRRFAANASHELRTPLAVQRVLTEVAMEAPEAGDDLRNLGAQLLRTNERNENLIEGLLVLAESDRGLPGKIPVRLDELAGAVLDAHGEMAAEHEVTFRRKLADTEVPGDPVLLERLIANLVSNAVKYNETGGWVEVEVAGDQAGAALTVRNTGQRVPAEMVPALFEPFRRLGADRVRGRGGVGLGLAIVRSIAIAHEGTIRVRPRADGGLELEIGLPGRPDSGPAAGPGPAPAS